MVEFLRQWLLGVCMTVIFCAAVFALVPNSGMKNSVRLVCAAAIAAAIFLPFAANSIDLKLNDEIKENIDTKEFESDSFYKLTAILSDEVTAKIDSVLRENGYSDCEINVLTSQNENGLVIIKRVDIKVPNFQKIDDSTQEKLHKLAGENAIIIFS